MVTALFIGRFQPFHVGHLDVVNEILKNNYLVIIGIGSSQENRTKTNPFSYEERKEMISLVLPSEIKIMPIPDLPDDDEWADYIIHNIKFDLIYTGNSSVAEIFARKNINCIGFKIIHNISATEIRKRIITENNWKALVPKQVYDYLRINNLTETTRNIGNSS